MDTVKDFVSSIASGENLDAEQHFKASLAAKVGDALETKRQEESEWSMLDFSQIDKNHLIDGGQKLHYATLH